MKQEDILKKVINDINIIESKILNHRIFTSNDVIVDETSDIRLLTREYLNLQNKLFSLFEFNKSNLDFFIEKQKNIDVIYEKIKEKSDFYLKDESISYNILYKKIMDAFDNVVKIFTEYNNIIKGISGRILNDILRTQSNIKYIKLKNKDFIESDSRIYTDNLATKKSFMYKYPIYDIYSSVRKIVACKIISCKMDENIEYGYFTIVYNDDTENLGDD